MERQYEGDPNKPKVIIVVMIGLTAVLAWLFGRLNDPFAIAAVVVLVGAGFVFALVWARSLQRDQDTEMMQIHMNATIQGQQQAYEMLANATKLMLELSKLTPHAPQLNAPTRLVQTGPNSMVAESEILADCDKILSLRDAGYPKPRRKIIVSALGVDDHARIQRDYETLVQWGEIYRTPDGNYEWIYPEQPRNTGADAVF